MFELDAKLIVDLLQKEENHLNCKGTLVSDCMAGLKEIPIILWSVFSTVFER